ncbi:TRAP transporter large permease [Salipiger marinus]|jgi:C4-dicarboxylate transporter, DctM subunit|uniref:TRAP transporter large permease protein n=1 Tax=Salipiger marinus TaxID=555512 RepID=A0A1G8PBA3_9RHOB|nr:MULTISPECIES: TRAP transporter large permease [Salipiger]HBM60923.1 TRAP transporter large permease [Citreicella sp.]MCD1618943.1 TRAP transporter large permease [Salipiger manganoxidans]MEB3419852.1 TRAP transporter large permease [Salipiger manganoxidans]SDI89598.1 C4-dicarboxylate transporter, DctM subunit [Salipiger marinus]HBT02103.1 TRAP transporter large permease [Citreicella sp.]
MTSALLFGSFFLLLAIGVPIGIALGAASLIAIAYIPFLNFDLYALGLVSGIDSFTLIAVVLFTLAGNIMSQGGISNRLVRVADLAFGRAPGDLGTVTIMACLFFAAISGTGSATVAAIGLAMIPALVARGYDRAYAGAMVASAGGLGVMIPPSVVMIVYAVQAGVSVTALFMAGIVPGLVIAATLIVYNWLNRRKVAPVVVEPPSRGALLAALNEAKLALLMPAVVLGGIYGGLVTPTESSAVAVVYALVVSVCVYRELPLRALPGMMLESALLVSTVLVIIGASVAFGRIIALEQIPQALSALVLSLTQSKVLVLLAALALLLIVGTFLETLAAIVILTPVLLPVMVKLGVDPVHFGIIMIVALAIGFVTPPLGANLFMAAQVGRIPFDAIARRILPWVLAMIVALLIISFLPGLSLGLPRIFLDYGG